MKTLLPFIFSIIIPGSGQILLKDYSRGVLMIIISLGPGLIVPIIIFQYLYLGTMIWSLIDIYLKTEKISGRTKATRYLIFSIIIVIIIIPTVFYLTTISFYKGGLYVKSEYFDSNNTKEEMVVICDNLDRYYNSTRKYPSDYQKFVCSKPIWDGWKRDSWLNKYRYTQSDSTNFTLTSSGKDGIFDTADDIIMKNE